VKERERKRKKNVPFSCVERDFETNGRGERRVRGKKYFFYFSLSFPSSAPNLVMIKKLFLPEQIKSFDDMCY
jgi:hypothetical protein